VDGLGLVTGGAVEEQEAVEGDANAVCVVEAVELELATAGDADIAQGDVLVDREELYALAGEGVCGVEEDGVFGVADADVVVEDVFDQTSFGGVGLDANAVVGPSRERSRTRMELTPPLVSLPMDIPWPE